MPDTLFDDRRHDSCLNRTFRMADEWREMANSRRPSDKKARITEYGILRSILEAFVYVVAEDKETDRDFLWLRSRIGEWVSEMEADGSWSGVSDYEAVRRIDIMTGYSNIYGDSRFDAQIERALHCCFERIAGSVETDGRTLGYLCRCCTSLSAESAGAAADAVAGYAARLAESNPSGSDGWLWCASAIILSQCERINNTVKQQPSAHSA